MNSLFALVRRRTANSPSLLVALVLAVYQGCYAFSYFPMTEGWFAAYGALIRSGAVPYRDFSLLLPPLYPLQIALIQSLLGESLVVCRAIGVIVTCGIGVSLFEIVRRFFSPWISAAACVAATIYYQSGVAFIGYDFTQFLTLEVLLAVLMLLKQIENEVDGPGSTRFLEASPSFFAGLFLAAAVLTKQSNGGVAALVMTASFATVLVATKKRHETLRRLAQLFLGGLSLLLPIVLWLGSRGALSNFFQQVVSDAVSAKGGKQQVFEGWVAELFGGQYARHVVELLSDVFPLALCSLGPTALLFRYGSGPESTAERMRSFLKSTRLRQADLRLGLSWLGGLLMVVVITRWFGFLFSDALRHHASLAYENIVRFSFHLYLGGVGFALGRVVLNPSVTGAQGVLLFALGVGLAIGNGTSGGLSEISAFLALAMGGAFLVTFGAPLVVPSLIPIGMSLLLSALLVERKFERPYAWWSVNTEDVRGALACIESDDALDGLCMEPEKYEKLGAVVRAIQSRSGMDDAVYVFPHMPIFNILSRRRPFHNLVVSWFDFTGSRAAQELLTGLTNDPPKVLLLARLPRDVFESHERLFNAGKPCVQRAIVYAVDKLSAEGRLSLIETSEIDGLRLEVYSRVDSLTPSKP